MKTILVILASLGVTLGLAQVAEAGTIVPSTIQTQVKPPPTDSHTRKAADASCVNPGNPGGVCWYEGWQFNRKSICIESGITGFPGAEVGAMYRVSGIRVSVRFAYGQCAAAGFVKAQIVVFSYFSNADHTGDMAGACAYTQAANYGTLTGVYVRVNVTSANSRMTACSKTPGDSEWIETFAHELGHAFGLSHSQPYVTSIMRDGHTLDTSDKDKLLNLYSNNPV